MPAGPSSTYSKPICPRQGAVTHYREALKLDPRSPDIHFELAEMLNTLSDAAARTEAEKEYRAALTINPYDEKSECRLGEIALRKTYPTAAQTHYSRALALQPDDAAANLGMARVLGSLSQPRQAEPY